MSTPRNTQHTHNTSNHSSHHESRTPMQTITFTFTGCTRVLDLPIAQERATYAIERLDFHDYFDDTPVARIHTILRGEPLRLRKGEGRSKVVTTLLLAQHTCPHRLWELLLLQAFEAQLIARRCALSTAEDHALDARVALTFLETVRDLPFELNEPELQAYVLDRSFYALTGTRHSDVRSRAGLAKRKAAEKAARNKAVRLAHIEAAETGKAAE